MKLRDYQQAAVDAAFEFFRTKPGNPCIVIPTGGGKTPVIAAIARRVSRWGRVLILAHVKELLTQSVDKLKRMDETLDVGVYSAGLGSRQTENKIIVAGIQSVFDRAEELGRIDLVIIDEAHLLSDDESSRYQTFIRAMKEIRPGVKILGLTATPYRMGSWSICTPENILNEVCFEVGIRPLIARGFLCDLTTKVPSASVNCDKIGIRGGEFIPSEVDTALNETILKTIAHDILRNAEKRQSVLVFAPSIDTAETLRKFLQEFSGEEIGQVTGKTSSHERDILLKRFRREAVEKNLFGDMETPLRFLVNVNVLTTGFDAPNVDCIAMVRPTMSPGLWYQAVGRGLRIHPDKKNCLILDYGQNALRHGPIDKLTIRPAVEKKRGKAPIVICPQCRTVNMAASRICKECQFILFERRELSEKITPTTGAEGVLSGQITESEHEVIAVGYFLHRKKGEPEAVPTVRVEYQTRDMKSFTEYVCPEHAHPYVRGKYQKWWMDRSRISPPVKVEHVLAIGNAGFLREPSRIHVKQVAGKPFAEIIGEFETEISRVTEVEYREIYDTESFSQEVVAVALNTCFGCGFIEASACRQKAFPCYDKLRACPAFSSRVGEYAMDDIPF